MFTILPLLCSPFSLSLTYSTLKESKLITTTSPITSLISIRSSNLNGALALIKIPAKKLRITSLIAIVTPADTNDIIVRKLLK